MRTLFAEPRPESNPARVPAARELLPYAVVIGGYVFARNGVFGTDIQSQVRAFEARLRGGASGVVNPPAGGGIAAPRPPLQPGAAPAPPAPGSSKCGFIAGVQYVAPIGNGQYETVIGGQRVFVGDQSQAEQTYNRILGC